MKAFVEVQVRAGRVSSVLEKLRRVEYVIEATAVMGHCDIVATVRAPELETLTETVLKRIHELEGVTRTETLICVRSP